VRCRCAAWAAGLTVGRNVLLQAAPGRCCAQPPGPPCDMWLGVACLGRRPRRQDSLFGPVQVRVAHLMESVRSTYCRRESVRLLWQLILLLLIIVAVRGMASIGVLLDQVTNEIPMKEAVQYPDGKEKWTRKAVKVIIQLLCHQISGVYSRAWYSPLAWCPTTPPPPPPPHAAGGRWVGGWIPGPGPQARGHHFGLAGQGRR
jgi:hypothetical protein